MIMKVSVIVIRLVLPSDPNVNLYEHNTAKYSQQQHNRQCTPTSETINSKGGNIAIILPN